MDTSIILHLVITQLPDFFPEGVATTIKHYNPLNPCGTPVAHRGILFICVKILFFSFPALLSS